MKLDSLSMTLLAILTSYPTSSDPHGGPDATLVSMTGIGYDDANEWLSGAVAVDYVRQFEPHNTLVVTKRGKAHLQRAILEQGNMK